MHHADVPAARFPLVIQDMDILVVAAGDKTVVGGDCLLQRLHVAVFHQGKEGYCLHHGALLPNLAEDKIFTLPEGCLGRCTTGEIHHCADGAGLGLHDDADAGADFVVTVNLGTEGFIGNVLEIYVEGGSEVISVLYLHGCGVKVPYPGTVVRNPSPLIAVTAVKFRVKTVFKAYAGLRGRSPP